MRIDERFTQDDGVASENRYLRSDSSFNNSMNFIVEYRSVYVKIEFW